MIALHRLFLAAVLLGLTSTFAQAGEAAPAKVVDELKQLAPANVTVDRVEFVNGSDTRFVIAGRADRNATVSNYLRALDTSATFQKTELLQIMLERKPEADVERDAATAAPAPKKPSVYRCTIDGREVFQSLPCPAAGKR